MRKITILLLIIMTVLTLAGCKESENVNDVTEPAFTENTTDAPMASQPQATADSFFEWESEVDFSDFEASAPTEPTSEPTSTEPPTIPAETPTEPVVTAPVITEPEPTQAPATVPAYGPDGYNNQIVRP